MHAALVTTTIDPTQARAAAAALTDEILPALQATPGYREGLWLEPADGRGLAVLLFEDERSAAAAVEALRRSSAPGVELVGTEVRRVAVRA